MTQPTKTELLAAFRKMHAITQELYACYCNDTQPCRATEMEKLRHKADKLSEIAWDLPCP